MSTYNGSQYIQAQLDSIKDQTRPADEVLIFDDGSSDNTYEIIANYIALFGLVNWKLKKNPQNYGWKKSFMNAISCATGDLIFTADQDDIWCLDKVEKMSSILNDNSNIELLVGNYQEFRFNEVPCEIERGTGKIIPLGQGNRWRYIQRPGCVFAFTKELRNAFLQCWCEGYAHDLLLWQLAALSNKLYLYDQTVILFRRHDRNATPSKAKYLVDRVLDERTTLNEIRQLRIKIEKLKKYKNCLNRINDSIRFEEKRIQFLMGKNIPSNFLYLCFHIDYYINCGSFFKDIYLLIKGGNKEV